jgi:hypothetical protein
MEIVMQNFTKSKINWSELVGGMLGKYGTDYGITKSMQGIDPTINSNYTTAIKRWRTGAGKSAPDFNTALVLLQLAGYQVEISRRGASPLPELVEGRGEAELWDGAAVRALRESCSVAGWVNMSRREFAECVLDHGYKISEANLQSVEKGNVRVNGGFANALSAIKAHRQNGVIKASRQVREKSEVQPAPAGNIIQQIQQKHGFTLDEIARRLNPPVTRQRVSTLARTKNISQPHKQQLEAILGV